MPSKSAIRLSIVTLVLVGPSMFGVEVNSASGIKGLDARIEALKEPNIWLALLARSAHLSVYNRCVLFC